MLALWGEAGGAVAETAEAAQEGNIEIQISMDKNLVFAYVGDQAEFVLTIANPGGEILEVSGIEIFRSDLLDIAENFSGTFEGSIPAGASVEVPLLFPLFGKDGFNASRSGSFRMRLQAS